MTAVYNTNAKKRPTNISVNSDLLQKVKEYKINISSTVESILEDLVKQKEIEKWKESNREAIEDYNDYIDKNGLFGDDFRSF
jgi:antitoxin CcdA